MKATTNRQSLLEVVGKAKLATVGGNNGCLPALKHVLIMAGKGRVTVVGNNLDYDITESCEAQVTRSGQVGVPPKPLEDFLKAVSSETVTLSLAGKRELKVTANDTTVILEGMEGTTFPSVPKVTGKAVIFHDLDKAIDDVLYAVCKSDNRPTLTGVHFTPRNGCVELAAADGFRLAITSAKLTGKWTHQSVIIRGDALGMVKRLLPGRVAVAINGKDERTRRVSFQQNTLVLTTHPIEGTFPQYEKLVPKGGRIVKFGTEKLVQALRKVRMVKPDTDMVKLQSCRKGMTVSASGSRIGSIAVTVPVTGRIKTAFNLNYLMDILSRMDDQAVMRLTENTAPAVFRRNGSTHLVMQMQAGWDNEAKAQDTAHPAENQPDTSGETTGEENQVQAS